MAEIYLISPPDFDKTFYARLEIALSTGLIPAFQLRLKNCEREKIVSTAKELKKICKDYKCNFLINDHFEIAMEVGADGVHVGGEDGSIQELRKKSHKNFIIGASCYDSKHLAMEAAEQGADYLSFGTFFSSKTKNSQGKPTTEIIKWCDELIDLPIVTIGGINDQNCASLVNAGANFIAVISYVWQGEDLQISERIKKLYNSMIQK
jgi:thiamine-phosphate pyrophosphorylase